MGADRDSARRRLLRALDETEVEGIPTTIPAHLAVLSHPDFVAVRHSTTWLTEKVDWSSLTPSRPAARGAGVAGGAAAGPAGDAWAGPAGAAGGAEPGGAGVEAGTERKALEVEVDGRRFEVSVWLPSAAVRGVHGGPSPARRPAAASTAAHAALAGAATGGELTVPMQGTVVKVLVKLGDTVEAGQAVCVLEAMKMENNIVTQFAGRVAEVRVEAGDPVGTGDVVVIVGPGPE